MENKENLLGVVATLLKWRKTIIRICVITFIGTILISLLLPDYYESTTTFYAASPDLGMPDPVGEFERDKDFYGEDTDNDRLLTIAQSNEMAEYLIKKFDLYAHYDIDPTQRKSKDKIMKRFFGLYNVEKTKYEAIEIAVEDKDSTMAARIVNEAREHVNLVAQDLIKHGHWKKLEATEASMRNKESELKLMGDSLYRVREKYKVFNTGTQGEVMVQMLSSKKSKLLSAKARRAIFKNQSISGAQDSVVYLNVQISGLQEEVKILSEDLTLYNTGMSLVNALEGQHEEATDQLGIDRERYKQLKSIHASYIPTIHLVEAGDVPYIKSRPKRAIIVISATLIAFILSIIGILLLENYREVNWKELLNT